MILKIPLVIFAMLCFACAQDGRACYQCNGAATNEECNASGMEVCPDDADVCENEVRVQNGLKQIFKRCKQALSCNNNFIQNPRTASEPTQCNAGSDNDVCRCCCTGHLCNFNERPCAISEPCQLAKADVIVVADYSSSVSFDNYQKLKSFIKALFLSFNLGEDRVHSALIRYNSVVEQGFNLGSSNDFDDVAHAVDGTLYDDKKTCVGEALRYVLDNILRPENGARGPDIPKIVIIFTDGPFEGDLFEPSEALRAEGAITFAVGIGDLNKAELVTIGGDESRVFYVENFDDLDELFLMRLQQGICYGW